MPAQPWTLGTLLWFTLLQVAHADSPSMADPLFQSNDILAVRIIAPMTTLLDERPFEEELDGTLHYTDADGSAVEQAIEIRTRGKFRRQASICTFPPLRLDFKKSLVKDTLFHKQDKLKLVTHCKDTDRYTQVLLREYLAYRVLNLLTDSSFRVRLMQITYVDSEGRRNDEVQFGFAIEHKDRLGKRLDKDVLDIAKTSVRSLDAEFTNLTSVYQFFIGNTDFSPIRAAPGEVCCHNFVLFGNASEPIYSIPYDFDQSGFVNAPHASPNENFKLSSVRKRLYRGRCVNNEHLDATLLLFNDTRGRIAAEINNLEPVSRASRKLMLGYVDDFYDLVANDRKLKNTIVKKCI